MSYNKDNGLENNLIRITYRRNKILYCNKIHIKFKMDRAWLKMYIQQLNNYARMGIEKGFTVLIPLGLKVLNLCIKWCSRTSILFGLLFSIMTTLKESLKSDLLDKLWKSFKIEIRFTRETRCKVPLAYLYFLEISKIIAFLLAYLYIIDMLVDHCI